MNDRFRQIAELSHDCIKEIGLDGIVRSINANGLRTLGAERPTQVIRQRWRDFWPTEFAPLVDEAIAGSAQGLVQEFEAECVNFAGLRQAWHVITSPLRNDAGEIEAILAVSRNISDRRSLEVALNALNASLQTERSRSAQALQHSHARETLLTHELHELIDRQVQVESDLDIAQAARRAAETIAEQAQKGEAVGQLLAGVVHDLNNVLQAATSAIDIVLQRDALAEQDARLLGIADTALQHGATMAQRLVGFSRKHPYHPEAVDVADLTEQLAPLLRQSLGSGKKLVIDTVEGGCCAMIDRHTVERALMNLVINARDACGNDGLIRIATSTLHVDARDSSITRASGDYVILSVIDNGHGMDARVQARLFEAYFTTKADGKGSGLGLAQVYGAVRQAGGFIDVCSTVGEGTRFDLAFPRVTGER